MPFANLSLGFKLVWRNKRRFVVVMSGLILAISIIGALFLVANNQSHEMGLSYLYSFRQPITIEQPFSPSANLTEYEGLDDLVSEADSLGTNVVDKVIHELSLTPLNPSTLNLRYFLTKNQTIDWATLIVNTTQHQELMFNVQDDFSAFNQQTPGQALEGRVSVLPKEIMVDGLLASRFNITLNDSISLGNLETEQLVTGYKVVGIISTQFYTHQVLYMFYQDFLTLYSTGSNDIVYLDYDGHAIFRVQIDLSTASIFNVNEIVESVNLLAGRIKVGLANKGLDYYVYNSMEYLESASAMVILFMLTYLLLMIGMLLPAIILAGYISKTIGMEMFERRSVEFSQFRSRGFSRQQMIKVLSSEVLVSSLFCSAIAGVIGIGISYLFQPIAATFSPLGTFGTEQAVFSPFIFPETAPIYAAIMIVLALLFVLGTYNQPIQLSFHREMIDSLKEKVKAHKQEKQLVGGIVAMYLLGGIPLGLYLLIFALPPGQPFTQVLSTFSPVIAALSIAAPFFLALATIKFLGEKKPGIFANLCTGFLPRSKAPLKHIATRNVVSKSAKIARLSMIVLFTIAFGFLVKTTFSSLTGFRQEKMQILLGGEISGRITDTIDVLNDTRTQYATMANVTRSSCIVSTMGFVNNTDEPMFTYTSFNCFLLNLTEHISTISEKDDKYLYETSWSALAGRVAVNPDIAVLPSTLEAYFQGMIITMKIPYDNGTAYTYFEKSYEIAGYYKVFPGVVADVQPYTYNIILNENPWEALRKETRDLGMIVCIETPFDDQRRIDNAAAGMNFTTFYTMTNLADSASALGMISLVDMPIFYNLLDIDNWLALAISLFGIATISFMRITKERKELGLFRIRGFDSKMIYETQLAEKYIPILIGGIIGVGAGILAGWITSTSIALNFQAFNTVLNYPIDLIITGQDVLLQAITPLVLYLVVILISIKNEIRQDLSSIMDEED